MPDQKDQRLALSLTSYDSFADSDFCATAEPFFSKKPHPVMSCENNKDRNSPTRANSRADATLGDASFQRPTGNAVNFMLSSLFCSLAHQREDEEAELIRCQSEDSGDLREGEL